MSNYPVLTPGQSHGPMVELHMTRQQFMALFSLVLECYRREDGTKAWIDVDTDSTVTVEDLLALLSIRI